jgi:PIN domain nuclease of toxin-antitoxin system
VRLLVDTHCWLWYLLAPEKLNADAQGLLRSDEHEVFLSAASAWEIVIKHALGKLRLPLPPAEYIPDRVTALGHRPAAIELRHVLHLAQLPPHHRDPFDRVLVAQAQVDGLQLVTADRQLEAYAVELVWAGTGRP